MDNIIIETGEKRITINNDPNKVISFNPTDVLFIEKFYSLIGKVNEYKRRADEIGDSNAKDENGFPSNALAQINFMKESCDFLRTSVDELFGSGISDMTFGKTNSLEAFHQFFIGIMPYVQRVRSQKVAQYVNTVKRRTHGRKK